MTRFRLYGEIQKFEEQDDGTLIVKGIASSETPDSQGDVVLASAMKAAIPGYMAFGAIREMHQPIAAGTALQMTVNENNVTELEALVVDSESVKKVKTGVLKGFSIGGSIPKDGRDPKNRRRVTKFNLTEVSLVDRPANPDAVLNLAKFQQEDAVEQENAQGQEPVKKGMYAVSTLAEVLQSISGLAQGAQWEAEMEGDNSPLPSKLKAWLAAGGQILQDMTAEEVQELVAALRVGDDPLAAAKKSEPGGELGDDPGSAPAPAPPAGSEPQGGEVPQGGVEQPDGIAPAPDTPPVTTEGEVIEKARMSKKAKQAMREACKAMESAAAAMKAMGIDDDEDEDTGKAEGGEALAKAEGVAAEALAKVAGLTEENEELKKMLQDSIETGTSHKARADEAERKLSAKGWLRAPVPVAKADDGGGAESPVEPGEQKPLTPLEAMKKVHATGGQLVIPNHNRLG